jgi:hypothetical protein
MSLKNSNDTIAEFSTRNQKIIAAVPIVDCDGCKYRRADKSLARPTSRYILFDGENISFDASLVCVCMCVCVCVYI